MIPANGVLARHARHLIEQELARKAFDQLRAKVTEEARNAVLPEDLREQLQAELTENPAGSWDGALAAVVARLPENGEC